MQAVSAWLKDNGVTAETISPAGDWLAFSIPVGKANEMLDTTFSVFRHDESSVETVRTLSYSVPADIAGNIDVVQQTVRYVQYLSIEK